MLRPVAVVVLLLAAQDVAASCLRFVYEATGTGVSRRPSFFVCDLESELPTSGIQKEGDTAYAKDSDKLLKRTATSWVEVGGGGGVSDGDKGDITVSGGGATWTIDNDVVSNAKLANMPARAVKGRAQNSSGDPADITPTAGNQLFVSQELPGPTIQIGFVTPTADVSFGTVDGTDLTIANDAVTFAKFQNITDVRLLGRSAGSSGDMQEITIGAGLSLAAGELSATGGGGGGLSHPQVMSRLSLGF